MYRAVKKSPSDMVAVMWRPRRSEGAGHLVSGEEYPGEREQQVQVQRPGVQACLENVRSG